VAPDPRRTAVFRRGTLKALIGVIAVGGHVHPSSGVGARALWKNAQKNEKKKQTSERIKRIIPNRRQDKSSLVWSPLNVLSRIMSRHHWIIVRIVQIRPATRRFILLQWNHWSRPVVRNRPLNDPVKGHGLGETKKYGVEGVQTEEFTRVRSENLRVRLLNRAFNISRMGYSGLSNRGKLTDFVGRFTVFCLYSATLLSVSKKRLFRG
jgi:hypothetical protein